MAISSTQITDYLFKKVGYSVAKTDTSTAKYPFNESIASPLLTPGRYVWQQDYYIPTVTSAPTSNTVVNGSTIVTVYNTSTSAVVQTTALSESISQETWSTGITNWIPPSFGSGYQLKLFAGPPGASAASAANFTQLPVAGSGANDSWFFDYQAGIVNFADTSVPAAAANVSNVVYAMGAVYTGTLGITAFGNLTIGNISIAGNTITGNTGLSFGGNVSAGNVLANIYGNVVTANQPYITNVGTLGNLTVTGNVSAGYLIGNAAYLTSVPITNSFSNANVATYLLTNTGNIAAGNLAVSGNITLGNVVLVGGTYGNVFADTITPYQTTVTVFNNSAAVGLPVGTSLQYPAANVAGYFRYNSTISTIEYYNGAAWIPVTNSITDQQITPSGSTASFTLNKTATAAGLLVSINGTMQNPGSAYTVSGTTITFAETPASTDIIDIRYIASAASSSLDYEIVDTGNVTVNTAPTIIDSFNSSLYRGAKYLISSTTPYDSQYAEVGLTQFGSTVVTTAYALLNTGANTVTFTANINGSTVNLLAQGTIPLNQLRIQRTYFNI